MRWKRVKWICIQQFLQLIHLEYLWYYIWDLALRMDHNFQLIQLHFGHIHRVRESFQRHICLLNQGQSPLHLRGVTRSGRLLQRRIIFLVTCEHVCPHVFASVLPPLF